MRGAWLMIILVSVLREESHITRAQCFMSKITTTQTNSVNLLSTKVDFKQEVLSFLSLTLLAKQENFLATNNSFIITRPSDHTCAYLGEGIRLHHIQNKVHNSPNLPVLIDATIIGNDKIILSANQITTAVSKDEFSRLLELLQMEDHVRMTGHHSLVFLMQGARKIVTNFNSLETNTCRVSHQVLNLHYKSQRLNKKMKSTWDHIKVANTWYGQVIDLAGFAHCIDAPDLEFEELLLCSRELLIFCKKKPGGKRNCTEKICGACFIPVRRRGLYNKFAIIFTQCNHWV